MISSENTKKPHTKIIMDTETNETLAVQVVQLPQNITPQKLKLRHELIQKDAFITSQTKLINYIIDQADTNGFLFMTQKDIANHTGIPTTTVARILNKLQEQEPPFLLKKAISSYQINPTYIETSEPENTTGILYTTTKP